MFFGHTKIRKKSLAAWRIKARFKMSESDKLEEIKQLVIANNQRVNDLLKKGASKPLKSSRLEVQTKFNEEVIALLERGENDAIDEAVEMLKARNLLLKKGDTKPEFFGFFDNHRDAKPDLSFAQCVQEALQEFAKVEATTPSSSQKQRVPAERTALKQAWPRVSEETPQKDQQGFPIDPFAKVHQAIGSFLSPPIVEEAIAVIRAARESSTVRRYTQMATKFLSWRKEPKSCVSSSEVLAYLSSSGGALRMRSVAVILLCTLLYKMSLGNGNDTLITGAVMQNLTTTVRNSGATTEVTGTQARNTTLSDASRIQSYHATTTEPARHESSGYSRLFLLVGVPVVLIVLAAIGIGICYFMYRKKRNEKRRLKEKAILRKRANKPVAPGAPCPKRDVRIPLVPKRDVYIPTEATAPAPGGPDLSPHNIPVTAFKFRGPLVIDKRIDVNTDRKHLLDDPKLNADSPKATDHVTFDDDLNEAFQIGNDVDVVIEKNENQEPPKPVHTEDLESSAKLVLKAESEKNMTQREQNNNDTSSSTTPSKSQTTSSAKSSKAGTETSRSSNS
ncbi:hypothetical protein QR680_016142 [Steinernema hermaphroditum]|uniref:Uncharacterized protein n=1 Tax=Steinernema hermaphroditum TaxID=289476 RepID=A0AA39LM29_9BILA|nr:hypothetical protein QR680_016142 [Steinernema hermaphroditum]